MQPLGKNIPLSFIENRGQWDTSDQFVLRNGSTYTRLFPRGMILQVDGQEASGNQRTCVVKLTFEKGNQAQLIGEGKQDTIYNYFFGNNPKKWRSQVPCFASVRYQAIYPGIDVRAYSQGTTLEYDLLLGPGADLNQVKIKCEGVTRLEIDDDGALVMTTQVGSIRHRPPISYIESPNGQRKEIQASFVLLGSTTYGFTAPTWDSSDRLVIDPQLEWSTFLGDSDSEYARAVAVNPTGMVVIAGETASPDFPTTPGAQDREVTGRSDVYVTALSPEGDKILFSTFVGGRGGEKISDIYVDPITGGSIITGETFSVDFPTTDNAVDNELSGELDGFVVQMAPNGVRLNYSGYLGGSDDDRITTLAFTSSRQLIVAGETDSADFPVTQNAYQRESAGEREGFVTILSFTSAVGAAHTVYSTYLGGSRNDTINDLAHDPIHGLVVGGMTFSPDFPTTVGSVRTEYGGKGDAFVSSFTPGGADLDYSTLLGGKGNDSVTSLAFTLTGDIVTTGFSWSNQFPVTPGAFQTQRAGGLEVFVTRLRRGGASLADVIWSTYLGGNKLEYSFDIAVDDASGVTLTGSTVSDTFPTTPDAIGTGPQGLRGSDAFLSRISANGSELVYSTYFGHRDLDAGSVLALDGPEGVVIVGQTLSRSFPTTPGSQDPTWSGAWDVFAARFMLPATPSR